MDDRTGPASATTRPNRKPAHHILVAGRVPMLNPSVHPFTTTIPTPVDKLTATIQAIVNLVTPVIQTMIHAISLSLQPVCQTVPTVLTEPVGAPIRPIFETITPHIQAVIDSISPGIETFLNTVTTSIQSIFDPLSRVIFGQGRCRSRHSTHYDHYTNQCGFTQFYAVSPQYFDLLYQKQRTATQWVDRNKEKFTDRDGIAGKEKPRIAGPVFRLDYYYLF
jgi:hypothetical protein